MPSSCSADLARRTQRLTASDPCRRLNGVGPKLVDKLATLGIVLYAASMWVSGIMQGLMWRSYDSLGFLEYSFVQTVEAMHPSYIIRALGGLMYLTGALLMAWNVYKTIKGDVADTEDAVNPQSAAIQPAE